MRLRFIQKAFFLLVAIACLLLIGCDNRTYVKQINDEQGWKDRTKLVMMDFKAAGQLQIITWHDFIPQDVLDLFAETYGVEIVSTFVESDVEIRVLLEANPGKYDLVMISDFMVLELNRLALLRRLNHDNIENIELLDEDVLHTNYDRGLVYTIPLFRNCMGIVFNMRYVSGIPRTWGFLLEQLENGYLVFRSGIRKEARVALGLMLMIYGYSPNSTCSEEIAEVRDALISTIRKIGMGLVGFESREKIIADEMLLGLVWNGNAAYALEKNSDIRFLLPEGKILVGYKNVAVSAQSKQVQTAEFFINYLLVPKVSARMTNFNRFANCNAASLPFIHSVIRNGPGFLFPVEEDRLFLEDLGTNNQLYEDAWAQVLQATPDENLIKLPLPKVGISKGR